MKKAFPQQYSLALHQQGGLKVWLPTLGNRNSGFLAFRLHKSSLGCGPCLISLSRRCPVSAFLGPELVTRRQALNPTSQEQHD